MADEHRTLAAALNFKPEAMEFISGGKVDAPEAPQQTRRIRSNSVPTRRQEKSDNEGRSYSTKVDRPKRKQESNSPQAPLSKARVAITTRFTQMTADALRRASLERKLGGERLHSQQEIIEQAVLAWLSSVR